MTGMNDTCDFSRRAWTPDSGPLIQAAGMMDLNDALNAADAGVTHIGFPLHLDVHAEDVSEEQASRIIAQLPETVIPVLITYLERAEEIAASLERLGADAVQAHGPLTPGQAELLKRIRPDCFLIKSLVIGRTCMAELERTARNLAPYADCFITDTYDPDTGASGATGRVHDWTLSRELARMLHKECSRPLILAGGLNPDNVARAIEAVRPAGVDAHTGLETPDGRKSSDLMRRFVSRTKEAWKNNAL